MAKRGETRDIIIQAATAVFFENGFEKTSVKMILDQAHIVTGSFYHFFPSKEALFEAVVERFLEAYTKRISTILGDETLGVEEIMESILGELGRTADMYFNMFQGDRLHWTIRCALHDKTLESMTAPLSQALSRLRVQGAIESSLDVDDVILANLLIKGSDAVINSRQNVSAERFRSQQLRQHLMDYWKRIISF